MNLPSLGRALAVVGALFTMASCTAVDSAADCNTICNRYKTCFDGDYDTGACQDRCRSNANGNDNYYVTVNNCEACIDDRSCGSATFNCASECSSVVP